MTAPAAGAVSSASSPRVEVGAQGADTRFIVTNLAGGKAKALYEDVYCRRGAAENHIKSWKTHLAADRTSCTRATANQFRLFLHAGAYWLMWGLRAAMPKRSCFAVAQFDTLRLRLIKIAARVVEMKTQIRLHLPTSCPDLRILRIVLDRIPAARDVADGAQTPRNEPADRNLQTPAFHHDGSPPAPKQLVKNNRNGDQITTSGRQTFSAVHKPG